MNPSSWNIYVCMRQVITKYNRVHPTIRRRESMTWAKSSLRVYWINSKSSFSQWWATKETTVLKPCWAQYTALFLFVLACRTSRLCCLSFCFARLSSSTLLSPHSVIWITIALSWAESRSSLLYCCSDNSISLVFLYWPGGIMLLCLKVVAFIKSMQSWFVSELRNCERFCQNWKGMSPQLHVSSSSPAPNTLHILLFVLHFICLTWNIWPTSKGSCVRFSDVCYRHGNTNYWSKHLLCSPHEQKIHNKKKTHHYLHLHK